MLREAASLHKRTEHEARVSWNSLTLAMLLQLTSLASASAPRRRAGGSIRNRKHPDDTLYPLASERSPDAAMALKLCQSV